MEYRDRFGPARFACPRCGIKGFRTSALSNGLCQKCRKHREFEGQQVPNTLLVPAREDRGRSFYSMDDDNLSVTSEITIDSACGSSDRGSTKYPSRRFKPVLENIPNEDSTDDRIRWSVDRRILFGAMSGSDQSRFSNETDDSDDLEDQLWHHERLIQHIKNHQTQPDGGHLLNLSRSDHNPVETKNDEEDLNDSIDPLTFKQDFHPLSSKLSLLSTSDQTMTSSGNAFGTSDSSMQGFPQERDSDKDEPPLQETSVDVQAESRFCLKQASALAPKPSLEDSSSHVRAKRKKDKNRVSLTGLDNDQRIKGGEKDANRFSLNLGDLSSLRAAAATAESFDTSSNESESSERERNRFSRSSIVDELPANTSRRKKGERGPNRFSLSLNHLSNTRINDAGPLDVSDVEEVNNAFVWSSLDVLRMAANNSDFVEDMDANPKASQPQNISTVGQAIDMLSSDDDSNLAAALDALHNLCELSDENKLQFANADASCNDKITRVITSNLTLPKMRETACKVLRCVATDRASAAALSYPAVEGIVRALSEHVKAKDEGIFSDEFANAAIETLANLAQEPSNHSRLIAGGILPLLIEVICNTSEEKYLVVCQILADLSSSRDLSLNQQIVNQGCLNFLFVPMGTMLGHRKVQKEALRALSNLSELADAMSVIVDNMEIVLNTFRRHHKSKFAQVSISSILSRISMHENAREVLNHSSFDALAQVMESNPERKHVQVCCCRTLSNMSSHDEITPILLSKNFIAMVVEAVNSFTDCEELHTLACEFFSNIGFHSSQASVEISASGGIQSILTIMKRNADSQILHRAASGALDTLTKEDSIKTKMMVIKLGAVEILVQSARTHSSDIKVLDNVVKVLMNLSSLKRDSDITYDSGMTTVVKAMEANPFATGLIMSGSRFCGNMALISPQYADEAIGGIQAMLDCMNENPSASKLVEEACKALRCMVLKSELCRNYLLQNNGVSIIEKTLAYNTTSQRWQILLLDELFQFYQFTHS
mmetsp:Transcript_7671/g.16298  ORF Transcript_7671/g.16298 Transcript_7671/m.16298 type:complete len:1002 (-) Transcript_7671:50-3055(-)